jgi:hypothetical protein
MGSKRGSMMFPRYVSRCLNGHSLTIDSDFRLEDPILISDEQSLNMLKLSRRMSSASSIVTGGVTGEGALSYRNTLTSDRETRSSLVGTERSSQASSRYHSFISEQTSIHTFHTTRSRETVSLRTSATSGIDESR